MHHPTDRMTHTTAFVTPVVDHWLEREILFSVETNFSLVMEQYTWYKHHACQAVLDQYTWYKHHACHDGTMADFGLL